MPRLSEKMETGTILKWLKTEGDTVAEILVQENVVTVVDQPLMQLYGHQVVFTGMTHKYPGHGPPLGVQELGRNPEASLT